MELNEETLGEADAVVVDGMENRFLGIEKAQTKAPIIDADGMTPAEVVKAVQDRGLAR